MAKLNEGNTLSGWADVILKPGPLVKPTIEGVSKLIFEHTFRFGNELELQDGLSQLFTRQHVPFLREVALDKHSTIDFVIGEDIGLEVKTQCTLNALARQLHRYAQFDRLGSLVLVTSQMRHRNLPPTLNNKPVRVVHLIHSVF